MLLILSLFIVLYELVRMVKMRDLLGIVESLKNLKDDKEATSDYFINNPESLLLALGETLYIVVVVILLFTPLFKLAVFLLVISLLGSLVAKVLKRRPLIYSYIDSVVCIISTIIAYHLFT